MEWLLWKAFGPRRFALELAVIYLLPVLLIKLLFPGRQFFSHFRGFMAFFVCWAIAAAIYARVSGLSFPQMGFTREKLFRSLVLNLLIMAVAMTVIVALAAPRLLLDPKLPRSIWFPLFYIFLSCPSQEFLYRGLLFPLMERGGIRHAVLLVIVSAAAYSFLHILFLKPLIVPLTFAIGIAWGIIYWRVRNIWGLILSHAVLGLLSIMAGLA